MADPQDPNEQITMTRADLEALVGKLTGGVPPAAPLYSEPGSPAEQSHTEHVSAGAEAHFQAIGVDGSQHTYYIYPDGSVKIDRA